MADRPPTPSERTLAMHEVRCEKHHGGTVAKWNCARCWQDEIRDAEHAAAKQEARKWQAGKRGLDWPGFNEEGLRVSFEYIRGHSSPSGARSTFDNVIRQARDQARREERDQRADELAEKDAEIERLKADRAAADVRGYKRGEVDSRDRIAALETGLVDLRFRYKHNKTSVAIIDRLLAPEPPE